MTKVQKPASNLSKKKGNGDSPELYKRVKAVAAAYEEYGSGRMEAASTSLGVSREALSNYLATPKTCRRGTIALLAANIADAEKQVKAR